MLLSSCFGACLSGRPSHHPPSAAATPAATASSQHKEADNLTHEDLVGLLWNGNNDQKAWAAQRVTLDAGGPDPEVSAAHRQSLLLLEVLQPLQAMLKGTGARLRTAAATAICNLALEADAGTTDALADCSPADPGPRPPWRLLYDALSSLVPLLRRLVSAQSGPDAVAALPAAQSLANLMRGAAFVPVTLPLLGPLPALVQQLAASPGAELKQLFSQMLLNAALHTGTAAALDAAEAPQALMLLLHQDAPAIAHERCLCTLYNMLRGEEGSARRAADIISLPMAKQALCSQLFKDQPNCRFLSACFVMCLLRSASENTNEWAPSGSDRYEDPPPGGRTPRRRPPRRSEYYRRVVSELGSGGGGEVWAALQHALSSSLNNARVRREFAYGRREQLLQALVAALHALCTVDEPAGGSATARGGASSSRRQPVGSSTPGLGQGYQGLAHGGAGTGHVAPLLELLSSATASALLQLLPGSSGAAGGAGDPSLSWACLSLLSLMTTSGAARKVLLGLRHPGALEALTALVTSTRALALRPAAAAAAGGSAAGGTPAPTAPGSAAVTPRVAGGGPAPQRSAAAARAAAAMRDVAAAYLSPPAFPAGGSAAAAAADPALAWGRCQALAAKVLRNLTVTEPAALLQQRFAVPSLLLALYGPARMVALAHSMQPAPPPQQLLPKSSQLGAADSPMAPLSSLSPRPAPGLSPRPSFTATSPSGAQPAPGLEWCQEVQRHAAASLVSLLVTAKAHSAAACAAVVEAGGIPVIAEVMSAAASAVEQQSAEPASPLQQQQQQQLAAWCATLLAKLYVGPTPCQQQLTEALLKPGVRRAGVLALLHLAQPAEARGGGASSAAAGAERLLPGTHHGPMYKSLQRRTVAASLLTLPSSGPAAPEPAAPGWAEEAEEAGAAAVVRLAPVMEQERSKVPEWSQGALATALGPDGDVLKSTAATASRPGEADAADVLRTSTQALKDLMSSSAGPGAGGGAVRRSQQLALGRNPSEELRTSAEVQGLAAMMRSRAGGQQPGEGLVQHGEGSSSSGGFSSTASMAAGGTTVADRAAAREEAMRQLEQWVRQCHPSYLDDPPVTTTTGVACDDDGTAVALAALEHG